LVLAVATALAFATPSQAAVRNKDGVRHVAPGVVRTSPTRLKVVAGGSIQAAVDAAAPGTTVRIAPGVYHQHVVITTNGITLRGTGPYLTRLVPPKTLSGPCKGNGICVLGKMDAQGRLLHRTRGVHITDLGINRWPGIGVFAFGTRNLRLSHNVAIGNGEYGLARFDSVGGVMADNVARGSGEAGLYLGDSPNAHASIVDNKVFGNNLGIFIRHSHFVHVVHNVMRHNCQGLLVLDDGQPEGAGDVTVRYNVAVRNNASCGADEGPPIKGGGILLLGATDSLVAWNVVRKNRGGRINSGGIVLLSAKQLDGGSNPKNNVVRRNLVIGNQPKDIRWDGTGSGNVFRNNACGTSKPNGLCS
jgi:nitrous oxidase accessory protein NosD